MTLKITSWNINSVRIRIPHIEQIVTEINPDVLCLQETKVEDDKFPLEALKELGFEHVVHAGQKSYNGVAILSKLPLSDIEARDVHGTGEKRHIAASLPNGVRVHNFYVPAGGDVPDVEANPKFADKLRFMDEMRSWSETLTADDKTVILGDFNIAPGEHDVWSHKQLLKIISHTPIEIEKMSALQKAADWCDVAREFVPADEKLYSWWSYRNRDWKKSNRGRRLDHIWVTPALKAALKSYDVLPPARDWERPSDHVPITVTLAA